MTLNLEGKVALISGASRGIGAAIAEEFAREGVDLFLTARGRPDLEATARSLTKATGRRIVVQEADLREPEAAQQIVGRAIDAFGRLDILVNCAGIYSPTSLLEMDEATWDQIQTVDLKAPMFLMQHVARHMIARGGGGRIVNVGSSAVYRARHAPPAYASAKAALSQLTRSAAAELGQYDINVNIVVPGVTVSGLTESVGQDFAQAGSRPPFRRS